MIICFAVVALVITAMDILWTPYLLERYRMDIYFLLGIACYVIAGMWYRSCGKEGRKILNTILIVMSIATVVSSILLCIDTVGVYYPEKVTEIAEFLHLIQ